MGESRQPPIAAILVGGRGRRIGGQKALIELAGRPLVEWAAAAAIRISAEVWLVAKPDTEVPDLPGVVVVREPAEPSHPLVGLVAALRASDGRAVVVCAGDMPFVRSETLHELTTQQPGRTLIAVQSGRLQPLLGRYEPSALASLEMAADAAAAGASAPLREVVAALDPALLEVADPVELFNVNTPEDLVGARAILAEEVEGRFPG